MNTWADGWDRLVALWAREFPMTDAEADVILNGNPDAPKPEGVIYATKAARRRAKRATKPRTETT